MSSVACPAGSALFQKDDIADDLYLLTSGRIRLAEFDAEIGPGETVGESACFRRVD
jgi:CRP-like cAMP-binding protein